jgi:hypothetical protein
MVTRSYIHICYVGFEVMIAVVIEDVYRKYAVFWDIGRVALVRTDVSEEPSASIIRVTRNGEVGTTLAITSNRRTLQRNTMSPNLVILVMEELRSSETSVIARATRRNIPEDGILHSHPP